MNLGFLNGKVSNLPNKTANGSLNFSQALTGANAPRVPLQDVLSAIKNPQAYVQNALQNNPQIAEIVKQYGGDPKQAFYGLAKQMGVDPNEVMKYLGM